jgi:serine/threonine-protein kinase
MNQIELFRNNRFSYLIDDHILGDDGREYIVGDRIAAGGNAVVHECNEKITGDSYAVKFQLELWDKRRERFQREVELLRAFDDPHIIRFIATGSVQGQKRSKRRQSTPESLPFVVLMKATEDLGKHIKSIGNIPQAAYLGQFLGLSNALVKVNEKALHRDIKPENILVVGETWVISDFGLCDLYEAGTDLSQDNERIGPALWMSPEAFNKSLGCSDKITETSDVFQLASVFWYVACGRHPTGIVQETDWKGPSEIFTVIQRALLHNSANRFKTSTEFFNALESVIIRS